LAIVAIWFVGVASAAEITMGRIVVLEGQIEPGDYDKLRDSLVAKRDYGVGSDPACFAEYLDGCPDEIYIASPGGDVAEAMKIGRLIRALGWAVSVPTRTDNSQAGASIRQREIERYDVEYPETDFMCASACFFAFVGGVDRETDLGGGLPAIVGIHRPYLSPERLRELTGGQAIATGNLTRETVEKYLKEMGVPPKYIDQMFSVPKDQILWINEDDFDADFRGFIPSLRDWVDAKCKLTDVENVALDAVQKKPFDKRTQAEWDVEEQLTKKQLDCEEQAKFELRKDAWRRWRKETLQNIADTCAARNPAELATAFSAAVPNQQSGAIALNLAQTAARCGDYVAREDAIRVLANRGDAKAQRILGNLYSFGGSTIAKDHMQHVAEDQLQAMSWYARAGAQGDLFAQKFYRDFSDTESDPNHKWTDKEYMELGRWVARNCPGWC
jgi:hypothetical protein